MKPLLALCLLFFLSLSVTAQSLPEYRWTSRVLVLFAPDLDDPLFLKQRALLADASEELRERDVVVLMATPQGDHENTGLFMPESSSEYFYDYFGAEPYQLELALVGLDGSEKFRAKNQVTPVSVLLRLIDSMPLRARELRRGYGNKTSINAKDPTPDIPDGRKH
ncbi:hypothetical protein GGR26_002412 [Lewinella marina]|nr:DUF4174 domain-containing protein [Neolewinella marina]NJB86635.1 hypothetical protein [Neolewinella marina]